MNSNKRVLKRLGDMCGGEWDSIYDAAIVAITVLQNVKEENALLKESLSELGGPKYFEEWKKQENSKWIGPFPKMED